MSNEHRLHPAIPGYVASDQKTTTYKERELNEVHQMLLNGVHEQNSVMQESMFVQVFLPVLAGDVIDQRLMQEFVLGSGGLGKHVDIVNERGELLFRVPPLYSTDHIKPVVTARNAPTMTSIVSMSAMLQHITATKSQNYLRTAMNARLKSGDWRANINRSGSAWEEIFTRYGYVKKVNADESYFFTKNESLTGGGKPAVTTDVPDGRPLNNPDQDIW